MGWHTSNSLKNKNKRIPNLEDEKNYKNLGEINEMETEQIIQ
jgi:hypothetical protein